jgi:hypothetical protein
VSVTEVAALTVPAVTVNVAEVAPFGTVTLAGIPASVPFELESETTAPPDGAAAVSVTVAVPDCPLTIVLGVTATLLRDGGGLLAGAGLMVSPNVSLMPESDAVKLTKVELNTVPALTVNVVEVAPWGIVTLDGTLALAGDELRAMVAPPLGAGDDMVTVQVAVASGMSNTELHENPLRSSGRIVTVPPLVDIGSDEPVASEASPFVSCIDEDVSLVALDNARDTVATTPVEIGVELSQYSTQVAEPAPFLQVRDLFAAAGPAATVADEKSAVE